MSIGLSGSLMNIGSSAFKDCTALKSVIFCDGVTILESQIFSGCSNLNSVHLPRTLERIQSAAFANCTSLTEIYIPNSVTYIADDAFEGILEMTFQCDLGSYATEFALDHQFSIIPTKIDEEEIVSPLNTDNSYYIHNYDGLSASGVMSMEVHYEMTDNADVTPNAITIHVYDYAAFKENTLTLDGVLCTDYTYDEETGRLTVPVKETSGTLRFCLKPLRYESLTSYARLICTDSIGNESVVVIGAVNSLMPVLNISAREETSESMVHVSGLALPDTEVSLYVDGDLAKEVKANKVGDYSADVSLGNDLVDGKEYVITAKAADRNGSEVEAQTNVTYRYTAPELVDFVMIYGSKRIDLLEIQGMRPVETFRSIPFRFEVNFKNAQNLDKVYVVSTRNNVKKYLEAKWDEELELFVAEGYFDPKDPNYVPGVISLEYVTPREKISFDQGIDFGSQEAIDALPQIWKDAEIDVLENTDTELSLDMKVGYDEEQISFQLSMITENIPSYINENNVLNYGYIKVSDDYDRIIYLRDQSSTASGDIEDKTTLSTIDFTTGQLTNYFIGEFRDYLGKRLGDEIGFGYIGSFVEMGFTIKDSYDNSMGIDDLSELYENNANISASQKKHFNEMVEAAHDVNTNVTLLKLSLTTLSLYGISILSFPATLAVAAGALLIGMYADAIMDYVMCDLYATAYGVEAKFKWAIDPSGYVYDKVTGERLSGVTVHAYWIENIDDDSTFFDHKPKGDEYGTLWDSLEYSQLNPLITDEEGQYAWDVPEGWWRVSYEKEGYETTWSEWLPVPPPQTDVNIGLTPLTVEHTHTVVIDKNVEVTCQEEGLTEGSHCSECGEILVAQQIIPALGHEFSTTWTIDKKATTSANGSKSKHCTRCDAKSSVTTINKASNVKLSTTTYVYNGKIKSPNIVVKDSKGKAISSSNYTISKPSGRKNVGKYTYKIKFKNQYSGTKSLTLTINPKGTSISSVSNSKKAFTMKWKKQSAKMATSRITGYQIQYSTSKKFSSKYTKSKTIASYKTTSKKITGLKAKKTYYVRIRTYKTVKVSGKSVKLYSGWSTVKKVKTK